VFMMAQVLGEHCNVVSTAHGHSAPKRADPSTPKAACLIGNMAECLHLIEIGQCSYCLGLVEFEDPEWEKHDYVVSSRELERQEYSNLEVDQTQTPFMDSEDLRRFEGLRIKSKG